VRRVENGIAVIERSFHPGMPPMKRSLPLLLFILPLGAALAPAAQKTTPKPEEPAVALPAMSVKGEIECSFGFGVNFYRQTETHRVLRLFVARMDKKSPAAKLGLRSGDEILSINGEKVLGMNGETKQGGRLFSLLCNREPGDTIEVEVATPDDVRRFTLTAIKGSRRK
jgi:C-terminal processing protease CtpA/Prc